MSCVARRDFLAASLGLAGLKLNVGGLETAAGRQTVSRSATVRPDGLRGLMVDAARMPEQSAYYRRLIDFCREWELNALLFRLTEDQGSALRFRNHPELITQPHALTPE